MYFYTNRLLTLSYRVHYVVVCIIDFQPENGKSLSLGCCCINLHKPSVTQEKNIISLPITAGSRARSLYPSLC